MTRWGGDGPNRERSYLASPPAFPFPKHAAIQKWTKKIPKFLDVFNWTVFADAVCNLPTPGDLVIITAQVDDAAVGVGKDFRFRYRVGCLWNRPTS